MSTQKKSNLPPGSDDLAFASLEQISQLLAEHKISSTELVDIYCKRIARLDPKLKSYVLLFADSARQLAAAADKARAQGRELGPLHGVPVAIKDIFDYAGQPTAAGSRARTDTIADTSANAVRRLEACGMIVLGKTHMVEFAFGGWGTNPVLGTPWNPWDLQVHRVPGGSSSGSAVAVAAGLAPAALGTDTGGSVRIPACWCGIVGLKTSRGLIGRGGVLPLCPTHDTVGPLTRTVRDAALLLDATMGLDPQDPTTEKAPAIALFENIEKGIKGLRIGKLHDRELVAVDPEIRRSFEAMLQKMTALGAGVEVVELPEPLANYIHNAGDIMSTEACAHLGQYAEGPDSAVAPVISERILRGREISAPAYINLLAARRKARIALLHKLDGIDAFVMPGCHQLAIPLDQVDENAPPNIFGRFINYLDLASLSIPIGFTQQGLPIGMQVVVRRFHDPLALRIGRAIEKIQGDIQARPPGLDGINHNESAS